MARLDDAFGVRLTAVTAGSGFGKSTLLRAWTGDVECVWRTLTRDDRVRTGFPELLPDLVTLRHDLVLVLDDADVLRPSDRAAAWLADLCRSAPPELHVVIASRFGPPFAVERLRGQGEVLDLTAEDLAFTIEEVAEASSAEAADALLAATAGRAAALRIALDGGLLERYFAAEVLGREPEPVRESIRQLAALGRFNAPLCSGIGLESDLRPLLDRGLLVRDGEFLAVSPPLRSVGPIPATAARELRIAAAGWLTEQGRDVDALGHLAAAGEHARVVSTLLCLIGRPLGREEADAVVAAAAALPRAYWNAGVAQALGDAHAACGETELALGCFREAAGQRIGISTALGWRMVAAHHDRGDLAGALATFAACARSGEEKGDESLLLSWTAGARCRRGEIQAAAGLAERALALARTAAEPRALACAHIAAATAAEAASRTTAASTHLREALAAAERTRDATLIARVRTAHGSFLLGQGLYEAAIAELDAALASPASTGRPILQALPLMNRGLCRWCRGELEEANADYQAAALLYRRSGSRELSYALIGSGDVQRERGSLKLAREFYEQGLALAQDAGDRQGIVPGLYQLAKVLVDDDPARAVALADRAIALGWPDRAWALCARGWIALAHGEPASAATLATRAESAARERGDLFGLAEALELAGLSAPEPQLGLLRDARAIWRDVGADLRVAITDLAIARLSPGIPARAAARRAERSLRRMGVHPSPAGGAGPLRTVALEVQAPLAIDTLGDFRVRLGDRVVPPDAWRSKKARTLLKILVSHAGRPVARDRLAGLLWPDAEAETIGNRLSVALSTLRAVLDPERRFAPDHFITAGRDVVALVLDHVAVDVQIFLHDATTGVAEHRSGRRAQARERLEGAAAAYTGDYLEADLYEDWAIPLRDQAWMANVAVAQALADDAARNGQHGVVAAHMLRILERDPLDDAAHTQLIQALTALGRYGDAVRHQRRYDAALRELGLFPAGRRRRAAV